MVSTCSALAVSSVPSRSTYFPNPARRPCPAQACDGRKVGALGGDIRVGHEVVRHDPDPGRLRAGAIGLPSMRFEGRSLRCLDHRDADAGRRDPRPGDLTIRVRNVNYDVRSEEHTSELQSPYVISY